MEASIIPIIKRVIASLAICFCECKSMTSNRPVNNRIKPALNGKGTTRIIRIRGMVKRNEEGFARGFLNEILTWVVSTKIASIKNTTDVVSTGQ